MKPGDSSGTITFQCFTPEEVKKINELTKRIINSLQKPESPEFLNIVKKQDPAYAAGNVSKIGDFFHIECVPLMELIHPWLYECQLINRQVFGYDIYWNFHIEVLNYNVYGIGSEYGWHIDENTKNTPNDMKLTCLLNLSEEPYEGGKFYAINGKEEIKFDSGMGLILTSLIAHKVTPVTKGERKTLTYWGVGPSWK